MQLYSSGSFILLQYTTMAVKKQTHLSFSFLVQVFFVILSNYRLILSNITHKMVSYALVGSFPHQCITRNTSSV